MKDNRKVFIVTLLTLGILLIATGTTYAFFSLSEPGTEVASTKSATVKLHYDEKDMQGIALSDVLPMDDTTGKTQNYFEFKVTGQTSSYPLTYFITARKQGEASSRIADENIRIYLTSVNGTGQQATEPDVLLLDTYSNLANVTQNGHSEQLLYTGTIAQNSTYDQDFRLRIWIKDDTDFTPIEENGETIYPMQNKTFSITVNVYTEVTEAAETCDYAFDLVGSGKQALEPGDEVKIDNEHFIVVSVNGNNTTLLAYNNIVPMGYATPGGSTDGLQYPYGDYYHEVGNVPFSKTNYFASGNLNDIYDSTKNGTPAFISTECNFGSPAGNNCHLRKMDSSMPDNYSVAYYVEEYADVIANKGATINNSRLLLSDEFINLVNNYGYNDNSGLSFWLGAAKDSDEIYISAYDTLGHWDEGYENYTIDGIELYSISYNYEGLVDDDLTLVDDDYLFDDPSHPHTKWSAGVRPVLEVPTCSIDLTGE